MSLLGHLLDRAVEKFMKAAYHTGRHYPPDRSLWHAPNILKLSIEGSNNNEDVRQLYHKPLAHDNSEIRILRLSPGMLEDDIHVELLTAKFRAAATGGLYPYHALSYTWGSAENPATISVLENGQTWTLSVTQNCEVALRHLRYVDQPRLLWVDAICINQEDLDERARQVQLMVNIYQLSLQVTVWLGPASNDSDLAMKWIETVDTEISFDTDRNQLYALQKPFRGPLFADSPMTLSDTVIATDAEIMAFANLLERDYFSRLWVWQEVSRGGIINTKLKCGAHEVFWQGLTTAVHYCSIKTIGLSAASSQLVPRLAFIRSLPTSAGYDLLDALDHVRNCECKDQRDRIYTSPGFGCDATWYFKSLEPSYDIPTADIYTRFVRRWFLQHRSLRFLSYIGDDATREDSVSSTTAKRCPSWVPDWSRRRLALQWSRGFCSGHSQTALLRCSETSLVVGGLQVARLRNITSFSQDLTSPFDQSTWHNELFRTLHAHFPNGLGADVKALTRVLTNDQYSEKYMPPLDVLPTLAQCERYLSHVANSANYSITEPTPYHAQKSFSFCLGRSLFSTDTGLTGIGPRGMQAGDMLAMLLGCDTLVVLRPLPSPGSPNGHIVIGSAMCTGLIDGEAVLGKLPERFETVHVFHYESKAYWPAFKDKKCQKVVYGDPRLPSMSSDWGKLKNIRKCPLTWMKLNQVSRFYVQDPRLDDDAIMSRGIALQQFELV